jgi:gas vesicle protein
MAQQDQGSAAGSVLLAFVIGAAVGAAAALLMAPASGRETREVVGRRAREARLRAAEAARQGREQFNRQRENLSNAFDRGRHEGAGAAGPEEQDA